MMCTLELMQNENEMKGATANLYWSQAQQATGDRHIVARPRGDRKAWPQIVLDGQLSTLRL